MRILKNYNWNLPVQYCAVYWESAGSSLAGDLGGPSQGASGAAAGVTRRRPAGRGAGAWSPAVDSLANLDVDSLVGPGVDSLVEPVGPTRTSAVGSSVESPCEKPLRAYRSTDPFDRSSDPFQRSSDPSPPLVSRGAGLGPWWRGSWAVWAR